MSPPDSLRINLKSGPSVVRAPRGGTDASHICHRHRAFPGFPEILLLLLLLFLLQVASSPPSLQLHASPASPHHHSPSPGALLSPLRIPTICPALSSGGKPGSVPHFWSGEPRDDPASIFSLLISPNFFPLPLSRQHPHCNTESGGEGRLLNVLEERLI